MTGPETPNGRGEIEEGIARPRREAEDHAARMAGLARLNQFVSSSLDMRRVLGEIALAAAKLMGAAFVSFWMTDEATRTLEAGAFSDDRIGASFPATTLRFDESLMGWVATHRASLDVPDVFADARPVAKAWWRSHGLSSFYGVPVVLDGSLIAVLALNDRAPFRLGPDDADLIASFTAQAALAIRNARLYAEAERGRREADVFAELARDLNASLDLDVVLQRVADAARELCKADLARIALRRPGSEAMAFHYIAGTLYPAYRDIPVEPGKGVGGQVLLTGRPFRTDDYANDPRITKDYVEAVRADSVVAVMGVPVRVESRVEGLLFVDGRPPRRFTDRDEAVLARLADHAAIAVRNARLYGELQATLGELEAMQQRNIQAERLSAIGGLASGVAHHFNNLLAIMLGRVDMLLRKTADPAVQRSLEIVKRAGLDAAEVVRRLGRFVEFDPVSDWRAVDLNQIVRDAVEQTRPGRQGGADARAIDIDVSFEPGTLGPVSGDPAALREALANLLLNAIDALPGGGAMRVKTWSADDRVYCSISDTGAGMSERTRRQALEPFFTTKGPRNLGLGLSVAYGVFQRHDGGLAIESAEGGGTTITLHLPRADNSPSTPGRRRPGGGAA